MYHVLVSVYLKFVPIHRHKDITSESLSLHRVHNREHQNMCLKDNYLAHYLKHKSYIEISRS